MHHAFLDQRRNSKNCLDKAFSTFLEVINMPGKIMGSCLDPGLPGTGPQRGEKKGTDSGPGPPSVGEKSQLEAYRDGVDMMRNKEEPIGDVMQEDQQPTE